MFLRLGASALLLSLALAAPAAETPASVTVSYAQGAANAYGRASAAAATLAQALSHFSQQPTAEGLAAAKTAWIAAHQAYSPTEVYRFNNGPIDHAETGPETKINAWPLDEQWVDATVDAPASGLINQAGLTLTPEALLEWNEKDGEKNIATGFHAIEFLLWGQDRDPQGPGQRPLTDFTTAPQAARRRQYLTIAGNLLVTHLQQVQAAWAEAPGTYRQALVQGDPQEGVRQALNGMLMLAGDELSGERIAVAWETQDQEEEQNCFSDTTHLAIQGNLAGIRAVWAGPLEALVASKDSAIAGRVSQRLVAAEAAAAAIPAPFDAAIQGGNDAPGRRAVLATIEALESLAEEIVVAAKTVGVELEFGCNPNNAIIGCGELLADLPAVVAAVKARDAAAATAAFASVNGRWLRLESALRTVDPILYKTTESALEGLRIAALRAKTPTAEAVQAKADALAAQITAVAKRLKPE